MPQFKALSIFAEPHIKNEKSGLVEPGDTFEADELTGAQLVRNGLASPIGPSDAKPLIEGHITAPSIPDVDPSAMKEIKPNTPAAAIAVGKPRAASLGTASIAVPVAPAPPTGAPAIVPPPADPKKA